MGNKEMVRQAFLHHRCVTSEQAQTYIRLRWDETLSIKEINRLHDEIRPMENPAPGCGTTIDHRYL